MASAPSPSNLLSRAAAQPEALANPDRVALLGAVARLGGGCALTELAADRGLDLRALTRHIAVLEGAGLLTVRAHAVRLELGDLAAVNDLLATVTDDVAAVRRFLVDADVLTREAGRDYRRV